MRFMRCDGLINSAKREALKSNECLVALLVTEAVQLGFVQYEYGFSNTTTSVCEEIIFNSQGASRGRTPKRIATDVLHRYLTLIVDYDDTEQRKDDAASRVKVMKELYMKACVRQSKIEERGSS